VNLIFFELTKLLDFRAYSKIRKSASSDRQFNFERAINLTVVGNKKAI
jgi:hypothetical protein